MNRIRVSFCMLVLIASTVLSLNIPATAQSGNDTTPPQVAIVSPSDQSSVSGRVPVYFTSFDASGIEKFEFYVDGELKQTLLPSAAKLYFTWNTQKEDRGMHELCVKAYDRAGNVGTSVSCYVSTNK
ncbi:MAG TPA: Ig-like domain-containing protein [Pyrinomonadaceae bacterium]|nr:Ig-like domain-containing protein [Pyrinomonadaceae bacterium]